MLLGNVKCMPQILMPLFGRNEGIGKESMYWLQAMCRDYYTLEFMDPSVDTSPIAPALAAFFDNVLDRSVAQLNFKVGTASGGCLSYE